MHIITNDRSGSLVPHLLPTNTLLIHRTTNCLHTLSMRHIYSRGIIIQCTNTGDDHDQAGCIVTLCSSTAVIQCWRSSAFWARRYHRQSLTPTSKRHSSNSWGYTHRENTGISQISFLLLNIKI